MKPSIRLKVLIAIESLELDRESLLKQIELAKHANDFETAFKCSIRKKDVDDFLEVMQEVLK
jgi:Tfp pilus assembly pilus retraction ATPase PilT